MREGGAHSSGAAASRAALDHDNILWVWNVQDFTSLSTDVDAYSPGSAYFDIATLDVYNTGYTQSNYDAMRRISGGKPIAIGECRFMPTAALLAQQSRWVYAMLWPDFIEQNRRAPRPLRRAERGDPRRDAGVVSARGAASRTFRVGCGGSTSSSVRCPARPAKARECVGAARGPAVALRPA